MGTRSNTLVMEDDKVLVNIYRQFDGYPEGHGVELAKLCDVKIVNGISGDRKEKQANGMGCLAAQIIAGLKDGVGGVYIEYPNDGPNDWAEYVYVVRGTVGSPPTIECSTHTSKEEGGAWPFNLQTSEHRVFSGTHKQWKNKYRKKVAA